MFAGGRESHPARCSGQGRPRCQSLHFAVGEGGKDVTHRRLGLPASWWPHAFDHALSVTPLPPMGTLPGLGLDSHPPGVCPGRQSGGLLTMPRGEWPCRGAGQLAECLQLCGWKAALRTLSGPLGIFLGGWPGARCLPAPPQQELLFGNQWSESGWTGLALELGDFHHGTPLASSLALAGPSAPDFWV